MDRVSKTTGRKQSELIREAVDKFLTLAEGDCREAALNETAGLWRQRRDLRDFDSVRRSCDRG